MTPQVPTLWAKGDRLAARLDRPAFLAAVKAGDRAAARVLLWPSNCHGPDRAPDVSWANDVMLGAGWR